MTQPYEIEAWLGPALDQLTPDQVDRMRATADEIDRRYPDDDQAEERDAAMSAAAAWFLGDTTTAHAGQQRRATQLARDRALAAAIQVAVMAVQDGTPKAVAARECGIDRMTLLAALGER